MKKISFTVADGAITIAGNYWQGKGERALVLLHMMPATKESWNVCAEAFNKVGYDVLAIDLRGHGESGGGVYTNFKDQDHQTSEQDVEGARMWFEDRGIHPENIYIGGASIGANLAIQYLAKHSECKAIFCLSAGLRYRGIETLPLVRRLEAAQKIFLAAAKDDERVPDAAMQTEELYSAATAEKQLKIFETGGHGTDMFNEHPDLINLIISYL
ncbi:alpha/beta hydrolase [Candidatus Parcubacteria bacterium]|nr:alpha/beta hydrolase [Candidatus Parcubacteria bacterium]